MKIFLDSTDVIEISKFVNYGIIDGITTNPSLISNSNLTFKDLVTQITSIVKGDISVEVTSNDYDGMIKDGMRILEISDDLVIKLPLTWNGIKACGYFSKQNTKVNMTLCFTVNQALLAAKAGATYVSPFIGRLDDINKNGVDLIASIKLAYSNHNIKTQILAASIRSVEHIEKACIFGADAVTVPPKILSYMIHHELTDAGLKKFNEDWAKSGKKI